MWKQISAREAAAILLAGGKVDDGLCKWGGTLQLVNPHRWRKARRRKELTRKLKNRWGVGDGWWKYEKNPQ